jgi:3-oxoacyl-[acyl-carrier-protein] synthase II
MVGQACASSSMAILHAVELIRAGVIDRAVAGGFDGFSPFIYTGFHVIGALSRTGCRPFDIGRDGTVLGEGAALLVLESEEAAEARSARPLAIFEGGGFASDGVHLTAPDREGRGLVRAIGQALDDAEIDAEEVGYINAHGTATSFNDAMECTAFRQIFDGRGAMRPISSIKSIFGHTLGAAGALDAIVSIEALNRQILPPTVNGAKEPLVEEWDFVTEGARPVSDLEVVLTTNSGFAGNNTALIFRRVDPCPDELCPPCRERRAAETTSHDGIAP